MADEAKYWWELHARQFQDALQLPVDVWYGLNASERDLRLIGPVGGKQLIEIGCGGAQCGVEFAKQGVHVTGVDIAAAQLDFARELAHAHGVTIEFHQHDMTDLSIFASGSFDIVFTSSAVQYVDSLDACFREVNRVLRGGGLFVMSVGHRTRLAMDIFLIDGTHELFRHFYGAPSFNNEQGQEIGAVRSVFRSVKGRIDRGATHLGVAKYPAYLGPIACRW